MDTNFNATVYLFNFIAISLALLPLIWLIPKAWFARTLSIISGAYILFIVAPRLLIFYSLYWFMLWICLRGFELLKEGCTRIIVFILMLVFFLSPMVLWKTSSEWFTMSFNLEFHKIAWCLSTRLGEIDAIKNIIIPVGLSFNTFRAIDLLIQSYLGLTTRLNLVQIFFFGLFPPVLFVGPIIQYDAINKKGVFGEQTFKSEDIAIGIMRIVFGLFKLYVLAYPLGPSRTVIMDFAHYTTLKIWISMFCFALYFYFNFSGYSDIAIGSARLYGVELKENFNYPYIKPNLQQFWSNWHMSLTDFAQRNVFVPLGGYRKRTQYIAIIATIMVIALWHDISVSLLIFGLFHAVGLVITRFYSDLKKKGAVKMNDNLYHGKAIAVFATFMFVMLSLPLVLLEHETLLKFYSKLLFIG